tara:strand:- start:5276 stop:5473 length:198 start_codon:yes stop_codon:yes gene_type:complete
MLELFLKTTLIENKLVTITGPEADVRFAMGVVGKEARRTGRVSFARLALLFPEVAANIVGEAVAA